MVDKLLHIQIHTHTKKHVISCSTQLPAKLMMVCCCEVRAGEDVRILSLVKNGNGYLNKYNF